MHQNAPRSQRGRPKTGARSSDRTSWSARILRAHKVMLGPVRLSQTAQDVQGVAVNERPDREGSAESPITECVRAVSADATRVGASSKSGAGTASRCPSSGGMESNAELGVGDRDSSDVVFKTSEARRAQDSNL